MGSRVNYTAVGAFVVGLLICMVAGFVWLTSGFSDVQYRKYVTVMEESVTGLGIKSPVKYNGVDVGFVDSIHLNPKRPKEVIITLQIRDNVAVREDTTATLESQGLTGVAFVGLRGGSSHAPLLEAIGHEKYPVIRSKPSLLVRLDSIVRTVTNKLDTISDSVSHMLSKQNSIAFSKTLNNLEQITHTFAQNSQQLDTAINNFSHISTDLRATSAKLPALSVKMQSTLNHFDGMVSNVDAAANNFNVTVRAGRNTLQSISKQLVPQTYTLINRLSSTSANLQTLSDELSRNPSILIRGKARGTLGPGERH